MNFISQIHKNKFEVNHKPNMNTKTKVSQRKYGGYLHDLGTGKDFLDKIQKKKALLIKAKINIF